MKKIRKTVSVFLCAALLLGVSAGMSLTASAESKVVIASSCDDDYDWTNQRQGEFSIDNTDYMQGDGCIFLDLPPTEDGFIDTIPFASMAVVNFDAVDTTEMPYFEMFTWQSVTTPSSGLQVNFCDPDLGLDDGVNINYPISNRTSGWYRDRIYIPNFPISIQGTDLHNIGRIRLSWLSYENDSTYYECDWRYDGLIFFNQDYLDARTVEETAVTSAVNALQSPTAANIGTVEKSIVAAHDRYVADMEKYPNFYITNYSKMNSIWDEYLTLKKADFEKAAEDAITAIGEITADNYTDKLAAIEAAEGKVKDLKDNFGVGNYTVNNIDALDTARASYTNFAAAVPVKTAIEALPAVDELTVENQVALTAVRKAYDKLSDAQKAIVGDDNKAALEAAEAKMEELLNPITPGDVNEKDGVTAADALLALQHSVQKITLEGNQLLAAEVDGKDGVTAADALLILQKAVQKIEKFPVEA